MTKWVIAYISAAIVFGVMDAIWLRWAGPNLYEPVIGEIMAENFRIAPAAAFYLVYLAGMCWFAIKPGLESGQVSTALLNGAILGAVCYATFDLTSQAVFKVWATHISVADILWGTFVTGTSAAIATWVTLKFSG
ncbi:MAG: DUF2177 family protein [Altererythrobacter sp.]|jgi:uncharacterized membrane protein|uniref:DUF2177 family protein n=1 Tax=Altererythrobacter rubellus TaxID=2173831 RepID=A0A9Y2B6S3_9SPHN|nr:DUF2177 family protein [Altererythrobacter rubellus]NBS22682.1 DUF2177 family protein [Altererythrobacter sp.]PWL26306.1 MAG: DUF2177 domain-containing protein [Altererythrobacter sp. XM-24bin4]WIW94971.1 DUF2177 family protein [Altererythrobacter rubellus]